MMENDFFTCHYCGKSILQISRVMHEISCNQNNPALYFCIKCQTYIYQIEESDHIIGHQLEEASNPSYNSIMNQYNNLPSNLIDPSQNSSSYNQDANIQEIQTESTEFIIQDVTKLPYDKKECIICMGEFVCSVKAKILPCIHIFHSECIEKWLEKNNKCPLCNTIVKEGDNHNHNDLHELNFHSDSNDNSDENYNENYNEEDEEDSNDNDDNDDNENNND